MSVLPADDLSTTVSPIPATSAGAPGAGWSAWHLSYHGDRDLLIRHLVSPLVARLYQRGWLRRFFFVRYSLGGPHVRLRLEPVAGAGDRVDRHLERSAREFFDRHPSRRAQDADEVRATNARLRANDDHEGGDPVYDNDTAVPADFRPEVERYGGAEHLDASLDAFTVVSAWSLELLEQWRDLPAGARLGQAATAMATLVAACAADRDQLGRLMAWGVDGWGRGLAPVVEHADRAWERTGPALRSTLEAVLEQAAEGSPASPTEDGAVISRAADLGPRGCRALRARLAPLAAGRRLAIFKSHLHMTANRLGLDNPGEVQLSRLLSRALEELEELSSPALEHFVTARRSHGAAAGADLDFLVRQAGRLLARRATPSPAPSPSSTRSS